MKHSTFLLLFIAFLGISTAFAQRPTHNGQGRQGNGGIGHQQGSNGARQKYDTASQYIEQKPQKGPNKGKMMRCMDLKVEMVTPSNNKKPEVSYFVYDSLNQALDAKLIAGTVKYVFGDANQYLVVKLVPTTTGKNNQYIATLEDWKDYKQAIVTLKSNGKVYNFVYFNVAAIESERSGGNPVPGAGGGGYPNGSGGGMNGGGMPGGGMNGGGMPGGGMYNGRGY